jgi:hypothetical protein
MKKYKEHLGLTLCKTCKKFVLENESKALFCDCNAEWKNGKFVIQYVHPLQKELN